MNEPWRPRACVSQQRGYMSRYVSVRVGFLWMAGDIRSYNIDWPTRVSLSSLGHCLNTRYKNCVLLHFTTLPSHEYRWDVSNNRTIRWKNLDSYKRRCQCVVHFSKQQFKDGELKFYITKKSESRVQIRDMLIRLYSGSYNVFKRRGRLARKKTYNWIFGIVSTHFYWCKTN